MTTFFPHIGPANGAANVIGPAATQTFIAGTGADIVHVQQFGGDVIDLSRGAGTVEFNIANFNPNHPLDSTLAPTNQYNQVLAFTNANDTLNIHNSAALGEFGAVNFTNGTGPVGNPPQPSRQPPLTFRQAP